MRRKKLLLMLLVALLLLCAGNFNVMPERVLATELELFTGEWSYVQNDIGAPEAAVIKVDDAIAVAIFQHTMIQLNTTTGVTPTIVLGTEVAASAVSPTGEGILIAGNQLGAGIIQVQNPLNGNLTNVIVNVVDSGLGISTITPTSTDNNTVQSYNHPVNNGFYSYADNHKIISTDGLLELSLDNMTWISGYKYEIFPPKVYFAEDGMLTVELYPMQRVYLYSKCMLERYVPYIEEYFDLVNHDVGYFQFGRVLAYAGDRDECGEKISYYGILNKSSEGITTSNTTKLPIRVITLNATTDRKELSILAPEEKDIELIVK